MFYFNFAMSLFVLHSPLNSVMIAYILEFSVNKFFFGVLFRSSYLCYWYLQIFCVKVFVIYLFSFVEKFELNIIYILCILQIICEDYVLIFLYVLFCFPLTSDFSCKNINLMLWMMIVKNRLIVWMWISHDEKRHKIKYDEMMNGGD